MTATTTSEFETIIEKLVTGGAGLGYCEGQAAFIPLTAPGDHVRARVVRRRKGSVEAELVEILTPGPNRREAPCPHYGQCGGCEWQHLTDTAQAEAKAAIVQDCFRRLGGLDIAPITTGPAPAGPALGYRNRIRLIASPIGLYGLQRRGSHEVVPLETCLLMPEIFREQILPWLRTLPPVEQIVIRDDGRGGFLVSLFGPPNRLRLLKKILSEQPAGEPPLAGCRGLLYNNLPAWGHDYLVMRVAGKNFRLGPLSFFQANLAETAAIIATLKEWLAEGDSPGRLLADLYCGVGLFSLTLADRFERLLAVDSHPQAVRDARHNAARDKAMQDKLQIHEGRIAEVLAQPDIQADPDWPDACCLVDPPRRGLEEGVTSALGQLRPRDILYLSCDPATLARDVGSLVRSGYRPERVRIFDQFPQTAHIESLVHLARE
jgi:23S rRNA (uracil1939-C5)-methyltransferase